MKKYIVFLIPLIFYSCLDFRPPSHNFSNFYDTPAERIVKAIEKNDLEVIREEANKNEEILNFKDPKYNISLLSIAILNDRKKAFEELLKLGANPNIINGRRCDTPLGAAVKFEPPNCNMFFINKLVEYNADVRLRYGDEYGEACNNVLNNEAIVDVIVYKSDDMKCGIRMLQALTANIGCVDLNVNNNPEDFYHNIINSSLVEANLEALKFFIIDLKCEVPDKIFVNGAAVEDFGSGYFTLEEILASDSFPTRNKPFNAEVREELLNYLKNNGTD
ncbi:hypothetical protein [Psychroflexus planctonicus]|uniref:Ankyrin repeat domain-containing protein n=1 Tax=Psychroflexus planctonicus TaxID=1526575 RepID=A0ABQ1SFX5_9FLAO|nr:hypothetical protein [Psychroflexus planctonicus]GGE35277.1 hypothetical protein GCM10010832_14290 [Psychroflexus planctonicus]